MVWPLHPLRIAVWILSITAIGCLTTALSLAALPWAPTGGPESWEHPSVTALDAQGRLYVVDQGRTRLTAVARDGSLRWRLTAAEARGRFQSIGDLDIDPAGRVYLTDLGQGTVERILPSGAWDRTLFRLQDLFPNTGARLLSFGLQGGQGVVLVQAGPGLLSVPFDLTQGIRGPFQPVPPPPGAGVFWAQGLDLWAVVTEGGACAVYQNGLWTTLGAVQGRWFTAAAWAPGPTLVLLDGLGGGLWTWDPIQGGDPQLLLRAPAEGPWSPGFHWAQDGAWAVASADGGLVRLTEADGSVRILAALAAGPGVPWETLVPWILGLVGLAAWGAALFLVGFRLLRRAFDFQIAQVALLIPVFLLVLALVLHGLYRAEDRRLTDLEASALGRAASLLAWGEAPPGTLAPGQRLVVFGAGARVPSAVWPEGWQAGLPTGFDPRDRQNLIETAEGQFHAAWSATPGGGWAVLLSPRTTPGAAAPWFGPEAHLQAGVLTLGALALFLLVGAAGLGASASRHQWARDLTHRLGSRPETLRRFFPDALVSWSRRAGPTEGAVLVVLWAASTDGGPGPFADRVRTVSALGVLVREQGALVTDVWPEGLRILHPLGLGTALTLALEIARRFAVRRVAVAAGTLQVTTRTLADRQDPHLEGDPVQLAWAMAASDQVLPLGAVVTLRTPEAAGSGIPLRTLGPGADGRLWVQALDGSRPADVRLIDYLPSHEAAWAAWAEGRRAEARQAFAFLADRLPQDPVVARWAREADQ